MSQKSHKIRLPYDIIVYDLEANQPSGKIIEIGAVKFGRDGTFSNTERFSCLVNIDEALGVCQRADGSDLSITELTGITDADLVDALKFPQAVNSFREWATSDTKNVVLGSWGSWDHFILRQNCDEHKLNFPFRGKTIDIKSIGVFVNALCNKKCSDGLESMLEAWNIEFDGKAHRAAPDAFNTARLLGAWFDHFNHHSDSLNFALKQLGIIL